MTEKVNLTEELKRYFGFDKFKGDQEMIIRNVLLNHAKNGDMVICMAGGGGNSLDEWVRKTVV